MKTFNPTARPSLVSAIFCSFLVLFFSNVAIAWEWDWESVKEKSKELASDTMDSVAEGYEKTKESVSENYDKTKQSISESYDSIHDSDEELAAKFSSEYRGQNISGFLKTIDRPPSQVINTPDGTSVYVWSRDTSKNTFPVCTTVNNVTKCTPGQHIPGSCDKSVFTDSAGIITEVKVSGCSEFYYFNAPTF